MKFKGTVHHSREVSAAGVPSTSIVRKWRERDGFTLFFVRSSRFQPREWSLPQWEGRSSTSVKHIKIIPTAQDAQRPISQMTLHLIKVTVRSNHHMADFCTSGPVLVPEAQHLI